MKDEYNSELIVGREFQSEKNLDEFNDVASCKKNTKNNNSFYKKMRKMGFLVATTFTVATVANSFDPDFSILPHDDIEIEDTRPVHNTSKPQKPIIPIEPTTPVESEPEQVLGDKHFPRLDNMEPYELPLESGFIENYIVANDGIADHTIYQGDSNGYSEVLDGLYYDRNNNVLTLSNCDISYLVVNLMGNGFTINLVGDNRIGTMMVWGYEYGGSVSFTGLGSLTINEDGDYIVGLELQAENSSSCIMVDKDVTLDIYGATAAIMVYSTKCDKGLYILTPNWLTEGDIGVTKDCPTKNYYINYGKHYTVYDNNGNYATHVEIHQ